MPGRGGAHIECPAESGAHCAQRVADGILQLITAGCGETRSRARNRAHVCGAIMRRDCRSGHAVVETALMAPWLFLFFIAIFDFGFYAYAGIVTANAARVAALHTSISPAA